VQAAPHPPQLAASVCVLTHESLQQVPAHEAPPQLQAQFVGS
jgi:hypothetical protein